MTDATLRRSNFGIPANERELIERVIDCEADLVFFDLEDSLAPGEKGPARTELIETIRSHDWSNTQLAYRMNGTQTRWWYDDIISIVECVGDAIDSIIIPKIREPADVRIVETLLSSVEVNAGYSSGSIGLSVQIETAQGMNTVPEVVEASDRLDAVIFGPADYSASLGASHGNTEYPGHYWHYSLSRIAHAAASADLLAIGGPYADSDDMEGFRRECTLERALGFDGKLVVDPGQVETANELFAPDPKEARRARRIVDRYEQTDGSAVAAIDGKVIDQEMYYMAKRIVAKAESADVI